MSPALTDLFAGLHPAEPFISDVDIIDEKITIVNPSLHAVDLTGYKVSDFHEKHVYKFPDGFELPAHSKVVLFCCPGKRPHVDDYQVNHLLWKNRDGSLRRKEVLNNEGDTAILLNKEGIQIAICTHLGDIKYFGQSSSLIRNRGIQPGEHTGVLPHWKVLMLPIMLLFIMSHFFEAPDESFHSKLQNIVTRLNETEEGLVEAHNRAVYAQSRYDKLFADFVSMQAEVEKLRSPIDTEVPCAVDDGEVEAIFQQFREEQDAEYNKIRANISVIHDKIASNEKKIAASLKKRIKELEPKVVKIVNDSSKMANNFKLLEDSFDELKGKHIKVEKELENAIAVMEREVIVEMESLVKNWPLLSANEALREEAISIIKQVSSSELEEAFSSRVEELKKSFIEQSQECAFRVEEDPEALKRHVEAEITEELQKFRKEMHEALNNAVQEFNSSLPHRSTSTVQPVSQRDFALRAAGGQIMYSRTSPTYSPKESEMRRLNQYQASDTTTRRLRSSISGVLTGVLDRVEMLIGSDVHRARIGLLETGIGGPDEAISEDISLGSCWAMEGRKGFLTVRLKEPLRVHAITIDHISREHAIDISTAPAEFKVYGYNENSSSSDTEQNPKFLLSGTYDIMKGQKTAQTFFVDDHSQQFYQFIKLAVLSNNGNPNYTCLYRFRIHGELS